jgi:hypothetical protein
MWGLVRFRGSMTQISLNFEINDSDLRVVNTVKQSILCEFLWFLKVINLRGDFEALNDVFN